MTPAEGPLLRELLVATELARQAGEAILAVAARARTQPKHKANDQGPVTEADLAADRIIRAGLRAAFPNDLVVSEEAWPEGDPIPTAPRVWCVDPLDGTEDFCLGLSDFAVQIGLVQDGAPTLGVVHAPQEALTWRGLHTAEGSLCERLDGAGHSARRGFDRADVLQGAIRVAASRSHPSRLSAILREQLRGVVVPRGSVGLKFALLVDGAADLYATRSESIMVWDTAAPAALLAAAGGRTTALDGAALRYVGPAAHAGGCVAMTPALEPLRRRLTRLLVRHSG